MDMTCHVCGYTAIPSVQTRIEDHALQKLNVWAVGTQIYNVVEYVNPMRIRYSPGAVVVT